MEKEHQNLVNHILKYIKLTENEIEIIHVKKSVSLEKEDKITKNLYFINNGFVKVFYMKDDEEKTTQINCPSKFITSFESFIYQKKSYE